jgi:hypothetical protein
LLAAGVRTDVFRHFESFRVDAKKMVVKLLNGELGQGGQRSPTTRHPFLVERDLPSIGAVNINHFLSAFTSLPTGAMWTRESRNRKVRNYRAVVCFLGPSIIVKNSTSDGNKV